MKISIFNQMTNESFPLDIEETTTIDIIKLKISAKKNISYNVIKLFFNNNLLKEEKKTMKQLGIKNNDLITIMVKQKNNYNLNGKNNNLEQEVQNVVNNSQNPAFLDKLLNKDEELATAVLKNDRQAIKRILAKRKGITLPQNNFPPMNFNLNNNNMQNQNQNFMYNNDIANQKKIEEYINKKRLDDLYMETYENYPELLIPTQMLFIEGTINNVKTDIFVDTGAQTTIISQAFAEKADLMQFVDKRHATQIVGVGTQRSVGKIWKVQLEIKGRYFVLTATILKNFGHDVLLGLDMMKRHHCVIDLSKKILVFGLEGIYQRFLNDKEVSDLKYKDKDHKIKKVMEILKINKENATNLLEKYNFDPDLTISIELQKKK